MAKRLTKRQSQILTFIRASLQDRGFPPSIREIGEAVGLCSSSTVHSHLRTLEAKGYMRRAAGKPRSMELLDPDTRLPGPSRVQVLERLLRRGVEFVQGYFAGMTANNGDGLSVGSAQKWAAEVAAVLPEVPAA